MGKTQKKNSLKEALELLESMINEYTEEDRKEAAKKVLPKRTKEYVNSYYDMLNNAEKTDAEQFSPEDMEKFENAQKRCKHAEKVASSPLKEALELMEAIINEKHVFPKKAVEDGNKKYLEADKKNNEATRLARKGFEKLNKKIKELEGKGIDTDVDIEPGVTYGNGPKKEYQQALKTADALHNAQREADREETKARNNQRKLRAEGLKGVIMRHFDYVPTKKGDSFNVKKVLDKNEALEEAMKLMEDILDKRTKNEKGMEATRKRSDHGASYRDYINHKELYPHNQGITGNEEKDLKREAKGLYKAIDHYNTWNKEHGYNPHPGSYITGLKCDLAKVKNTLKQINNYKKYGKHEALEEALNVLLEGRREGESQKDFKHRLHGELVRAIDKKAAEARDKAIEASKNYHETGKGKEEAIKASEKHKKEHDKLAKLDDIEPVANAYMEVATIS